MRILYWHVRNLYTHRNAQMLLTDGNEWKQFISSIILFVIVNFRQS